VCVCVCVLRVIRLDGAWWLVGGRACVYVCVCLCLSLQRDRQTQTCP
jgi:hypothetical protein